MRALIAYAPYAPYVLVRALIAYAPYARTKNQQSTINNQ
ncbi:hypothetical protein PL8927_600126 [Planktothrix serta PCC 8927]|uniref:Uncharacterized protein n=1 Tax=Planktothrix serta PCC 8927 TaxID=671068 RepID=A0A7Z9BMD9_9CYAN|nr:hypothetical protein PL8927_600126 [Planktothrix serta PCC 8927]